MSYKELYFNPYDIYDKYIGEISPNNHASDNVLCGRLLCDYYDVEEINDMLATKATSSNFTLMVHNIRSIGKNLEEFLLDFSISRCNVDALAFCETRLSIDTENLYEIPNYTRYSKHRNTMGAGVSFDVSNRYNSSLIEEFTRMLP